MRQQARFFGYVGQLALQWLGLSPGYAQSDHRNIFSQAPVCAIGAIEFVPYHARPIESRHSQLL
jgi:hypothetical protein